MADWVHAQTDAAQQLAQLSFFSIQKQTPRGPVEFQITLKEYATRNEHGMRFFAITDKQTNQKNAPFNPCGWGETMLHALRECIKALERFPYEGED